MIQKRKGMSITEVALVCVMIAVMTGVGITGAQNYLSSIKVAKARADLNTLCDAHSTYYAKNGVMATNAVLVSSNHIKAGNMWNGSQMIDPWGNVIAESSASGVTTFQLSAASQSSAGINISCKAP